MFSPNQRWEMLPRMDVITQDWCSECPPPPRPHPLGPGPRLRPRGSHSHPALSNVGRTSHLFLAISWPICYQILILICQHEYLPVRMSDSGLIVTHVAHITTLISPPPVSPSPTWTGVTGTAHQVGCQSGLTRLAASRLPTPAGCPIPL